MAKSKRANNSEKEKKVSTEALEKLNRISQRFMEDIGLEIASIKPEQKPKNIEISNFSRKGTNCSDLSNDDDEENTVKGPEVIVFNPLKAVHSNSKAEYKQFMSSKIKKLEEAPKPSLPATKKEEKEEKDNLKFDVELNDLLNNSNLIERLAASELTGKARRKHQFQQLVKLGCKPTKASHDPKNVRFEMLGHKKRKHEEAISKAKEEGNYHKSIKHVFGSDVSKKKIKANDGLRTSMGKFQDGVLHISKAHIKRNAAASSQKHTKGNKKGSHRR